MLNEGKITDRYPGLRSFTSSESILFFGRSRETKELLNYVLSEQTVLLFSKSGVGKSSLLYAGLFPELKKKKIYPIRIRFQLHSTQQNKSHASDKPDIINLLADESNAANTPLDVFKASIIDVAASEENIFIVEENILYNKEKPCLWELIKALKLPEGHIPVLVFDQFEEFFRYPLQFRDDFMLQLSELLHSQPPNRIINWLGGIDIDKRTREQIEWVSQPKVKCLFAIRDDRITDLDSVSKFIPLILKNRYKLYPLNINEAKKAIINPAQLEENIGFNTAKFEFDEVTLDKILRKLSGQKDPTKELSLTENLIDCSQLQKICSFLEKKVLENQKDSNSTLTIDSKIINNDSDIQNILDNFFVEQLNCLGNENEIKLVRKILEEYFVIGGMRTFVTESHLQLLLNFNEELINKMLTARLIKEEYIHLGKGYELSHDTLIPSVTKSKKERVTEEEKLKLEQAKKEAEEKLHEKEIVNAQINELIQLREKSLDIALEEKARAESAEKKTFEEKRKVEAEKNKANKWKTRSYILSTLTFITFLFTLYFYLQKDGQYSKILNYEAIRNYENGNTILAYELWDKIDEFNKRDSAGIRTIREKTFTPFSGKQIEFSNDFLFIATLYTNGKLFIWKDFNDEVSLAGKVDAIIKTFSFYGNSTLVYTLPDAGGTLVVWDLLNKKNKKTVTLDNLKVLEINASSPDLIYVHCNTADYKYSGQFISKVSLSVYRELSDTISKFYNDGIFNSGAYYSDKDKLILYFNSRFLTLSKKNGATLSEKEAFRYGTVSSHQFSYSSPLVATLNKDTLRIISGKLNIPDKIFYNNLFANTGIETFLNQDSCLLIGNAYTLERYVFDLRLNKIVYSFTADMNHYKVSEDNTEILWFDKSNNPKLYSCITKKESVVDTGLFRNIKNKLSIKPVGHKFYEYYDNDNKKNLIYRDSLSNNIENLRERFKNYTQKELKSLGVN